LKALNSHFRAAAVGVGKKGLARRHKMLYLISVELQVGELLILRDLIWQALNLFRSMDRVSESAARGSGASRQK